MSRISKGRAVFSLAGSIIGAVGAISDVRAARGERDKLALANALASVLVVITGALLAVRSLRGGDGS